MMATKAKSASAKDNKSVPASPETLPVWQLDHLYPGMSSEAFVRDIAAV